MPAQALLIVDMQQALVPHMWEAEALVERLAVLADRARAAGVPVVLLQQSGPTGGSLTPDTPGWQLVPALRPRDGDLVMSKTATDSFYATCLADLLRERHVDTVVLGGLASDYCVDATARSAISHRFNVDLLADGHSTVNSSQTELSAPQIVAHHNRVLAGAIHPGGELRLITCAAAVLGAADHHASGQPR